MDNVVDRYPVEVLKGDASDDWAEDNGTMPENVDALREAVIGRKIVSAQKKIVPGGWRGTEEALVLELDNGTQVQLVDSSDCCAYTSLESFLLDPRSVDYAILGVGTTESYTKWHIYADFGDVMQMEVGWSAGNPFYYGYGFDIAVKPIVIDAEVVANDQAELGSGQCAIEG